jgi:hypothetical protein
MRTTDALVTYEDVNIMGLFPLDSTPASTQKIITKIMFKYSLLTLSL